MMKLLGTKGAGMARTHINIPTGGRVDVQYLEDLSDQLANCNQAKIHPFKLED